MQTIAAVKERVHPTKVEKRWGKFVDASDISQVGDGDRLTITSQPLPESKPHMSYGKQCASGNSPLSDPKKPDAEHGQICCKSVTEDSCTAMFPVETLAFLVAKASSSEAC